MSEADKDEALRLIARILHLTRPTVELDNLRTLIERQNDTDGEMWRFCVEHGFPQYERGSQCWSLWCSRLCIGDTPAEAVQAAMAAMKEKA